MLLRGHPSGDPARADGWHDYVRMLRQQATTRPRLYFGTEVDAEKPLNVMALTVAECLGAPRGVPSTRGRRRVTVTLHDDTSWTVTGEADLDFDDPSHRDSGVPRLVTSPACCAIVNRLDVEVTGGVDEDVPFNVDPDTFIYIRRNATLRVDAAIGDVELYGEPAPAWWEGWPQRLTEVLGGGLVDFLRPDDELVCVDRRAGTCGPEVWSLRDEDEHGDVAGEDARRLVIERLNRGQLETWFVSDRGRLLAVITNTARAMVMLLDHADDPGVHAASPGAGGLVGGFVLENGQVDVYAAEDTVSLADALNAVGAVIDTGWAPATMDWVCDR